MIHMITVNVTEAINHKVTRYLHTDAMDEFVRSLASDPAGTVNSVTGPHTWQSSEFEVEGYEVTETRGGE